MVNRAGINGVKNGAKPPDNKLKATLHDFARRQLSVEDRLAELSRFYEIGKTKLMQLNKVFRVPSVRKPPPLEICTALVAEKALDNSKANRETSALIPRDTVRKIQSVIAPEGAELRFPGRRKALKFRGQLTAVSIMEEVHCDGHEKLGSKALQMGPVGIPIYAFCDHTGKALHMTVVPNDRCQVMIGHVFLDFIGATGEMPVQLTFDGGTETGCMRGLQQELRSASRHKLTSHLRRRLLPELLELERPSTGYNSGRSSKQFIRTRKHESCSHIVQKQLTMFQDYWNTTPCRKQKNKLLPTAAPDMVFNYLEKYDLERCGTAVPTQVIQELRTRLSKTHEEVMQWVPAEFDEVASVAYEAIGSPSLHYSTGWLTFREMLEVVENLTM
ncbi:hypothetical protein GGX14DRAFT_394700 [Mycena pura]|uniref:Uncharacterized protein n=1 Tax=Mycena pura TaxID=153505 RepID=A0AAD6YBU2_9AGAR|nr:hypothetical protein GGX14DRAFT_394700 [Mycena pura]